MKWLPRDQDGGIPTVKPAVRTPGSLLDGFLSETQQGPHATFEPFESVK